MQVVARTRAVPRANQEKGGKSVWADIAFAKCQIAHPEFIPIDLT